MSEGPAQNGDDVPAPDIRIAGGNPTAAEVAAVTAVVTAALEEILGEHRRRRTRGPSAWARSQRDIRQPLVRGAWRTWGR